jgi:hypothetical protein
MNARRRTTKAGDQEAADTTSTDAASGREEVRVTGVDKYFVDWAHDLVAWNQETNTLPGMHSIDDVANPALEEILEHTERRYNRKRHWDAPVKGSGPRVSAGRPHAGTATLTFRGDPELMGRARGLLKWINEQPSKQVENIQDQRTLLERGLAHWLKAKPRIEPVTVNKLDLSVYEQAQGLLHVNTMTGIIPHVLDLSDVASNALAMFLPYTEKAYNRGRRWPTPVEKSRVGPKPGKPGRHGEDSDYVETTKRSFNAVRRDLMGRARGFLATAVFEGSIEGIYDTNTLFNHALRMYFEWASEEYYEGKPWPRPRL